MNPKPPSHPPLATARVSRQRPGRSTLSFPAEFRASMEARGARSDRSHGPYNFTRELARTLGRFDAVIERSDPRRTRELPPEHYDLVVEAMTDAASIETFGIAHLGAYLLELPAFAARARELALDPAVFCELIDRYSFAEKLHLVSAAQARHAPAR
jgi:hypothetical protein